MTTSMYRSILLCLIGISCSAIADVAQLPPELASLPNVSFHEPNLIASGRLQPGDIAKIAAAGVHEVIDLSVDSETPDFDEAAAVEQAGMRYRNLPISGAADLGDKNVRQFDEMISNAGTSLVLIHCASSNRVGALMALRAATLKGASPEAAIEVGRKWGLSSLEPAVRERLDTPGDRDR
ncbi:MAG: sulfur transferase domain-containing protein [Gammaproteobacteria bacterium]